MVAKEPTSLMEPDMSQPAIAMDSLIFDMLKRVTDRPWAYKSGEKAGETYLQMPVPNSIADKDAYVAACVDYSNIGWHSILNEGASGRWETKPNDPNNSYFTISLNDIYVDALDWANLSSEKMAECIPLLKEITGCDAWKAKGMYASFHAIASRPKVRIY